MLRRILAKTAAFLALPLTFGALGLVKIRARERPEAPPAAGALDAPRPGLDPGKRTVVVVLGADLTEVTDTLGPYEMFARAGGFNVVTAGPARAPTLLTGGLRILPHYAFAELDGRPIDVVVVPNIPNIASAANAPVVAFLRQQAARGALMHSWCTGAMALAQAGLLDGRTATAHWGDLARLARAYPAVRWIRGVRWIDHGQLVMSAGLTSGIDASLHVIARLTDEATARRVARELRYPGFHFALDPTAEPYRLEPADTIILANAAFRFRRARIGVALYPGMGELDLSNLYDAHAFTFVADLVSVGEGAVVVTAHGLTLLPSRDATGLDRFIVPGIDGRAGAAALVSPSLPRPEYLHADAPGRFGLEPVLEDLARTADRPTARFAQRRLEYRSGSIQLAGSPIAWGPLSAALAVGAFGLVLARVASARDALCSRS